jgi:hypothetical protein
MCHTPLAAQAAALQTFGADWLFRLPIARCDYLDCVIEIAFRARTVLPFTPPRP